MTVAEYISASTLVFIALSAAFVGYQTLILRREVKNMTRESSLSALAATDSLYQGIAGQMLEIDRFFFDQPQFRAYLYGERVPSHLKVDEQRRLDSIVEMFIDFADNVFIQAKNLKAESYPGQGDLWDSRAGYFHGIYEKSPVVKDFIAKNPGWYESGLCQVLEQGRLQAQS
jgi:hypothetical protein